MRPFALCADDFGLSAQVSHAVLEACAAGRVTAVSAMTAGAEWRTAAAMIRPYLDRIDVGLHLNLSEGSPLGAAPSLAPAGSFRPPGRLIGAALAGALPLSEIGAEIGRQLDAFTAEIGRAPVFVDGHWHVHVLPGVRRALFGELERRNLSGRIWLRDSGDAVWRIAARRGAAAKALVVAALAAGFSDEARRAGFQANDGFAGYSAFHPGADLVRAFQSYLTAPGPRHLVMCHPGFPHELSFLVSSQFVRLIEARRLRLAKMSDMMGLSAVAA